MSANVQQVSQNDFQREVLEETLPVVVDFWAPWCGPCRMLTPELEKAAEQLEGRVKIVKVNVDEAPSLAASHRVMGVPTLLIIHGGKEIDRHVGFLPAGELIKSLEKYMATAAA